MKGGNKKKEIESHVVHSFSSSSDSLFDDFQPPKDIEEKGRFRSPFEAKPAFMKDAGNDWGCLFKGDSSAATSKSSTAVKSLAGSLDKHSKWDETSRVGYQNTLSNKGGTGSLTDAEKSLHDLFATESSSMDGLDALIEYCRKYYQSPAKGTSFVKQGGPQPAFPCPQLMEFFPEIMDKMRR